MDTGLGAIFRGMYRLKEDEYELAGNPAVSYQNYLEAMRRSPASKLHARLRSPDQLWSLAKVGLLISDVLVLSGSEGADSVKFTILHGQTAVAAGGFLLPAGSYDENSRYSPGFATYADTRLADWLRFAEPFIEEGRLLYLPERIVFERLPRETHPRTAGRLTNSAYTPCGPTLPGICGTPRPKPRRRTPPPCSRRMTSPRSPNCGAWHCPTSRG